MRIAVDADIECNVRALRSDAADLAGAFAKEHVFLCE